VTTEAGGSAQLTVVLDSEPTADVMIALSSSNTDEGSISPAEVTFTAENWNTPQQATVTGVDDDVDDGDMGYTIVTAAATSSDTKYNGIDAPDVAVTNEDDDEGFIPVDLGRVDFKRLESLNPSAGELWFRLETTHDGWLTIEPAGEWTAAQLTLELYAPGDVETPLNPPVPTNATPRIDHSVLEGQVYLLKVTGPATEVTLLFLNQLHEQEGALAVYGTDQNDVIVFDAGASREVTINGVAYHYEDTEVSTVNVDTGDGFDEVWLYDSTGNENLEAWPDRAVLTMAGSETEEGYSVELTGFESLLSYATRGGNDSATLHGSERSDKFKSYEDSVRLRAKNSVYALRAKKFDTIVGDSGPGGNDAAVFKDAVTFTYNGAENSALVEGKRRDHQAMGFASLIVRAAKGDGNVAHFTDIPTTDTGVDDVFYFRGHKTQLVGQEVKVTARSFDEVHATASESGFDVARVYDTALDEHLEIAGDSIRFYRRNGAELDLIYEALGFERAKVYSTEGDDTKDIQDHNIDLYLYGFE
jgi:hypothetical protein